MQVEIKIFLMVFITWLISDILKTVIDSIKHKKFRPRMLLAYGGMPSSHSSLVSSMSMSLFLIEGITSVFLLSIGIAILVIRDLVTLRARIDENSKAISVISKDNAPYPLSHNTVEIIAGIALGIICPMILNLVI